nr:fatty acid desaturase [Nitrosomonas nitrosa]
MLQNEYIELRSRLEKVGLFKLSNTFGLVTMGVELGLLALAGVFLVSVEQFTVWYWAGVAFIAVSCFRCFVLLHECGHYTLFRTRMLNDLAGFILSPICLMPYVPWRNVHVQHHRWVGIIDKDPTQAHLLKLKDERSIMNGLFKIVWMAWLPIPWIKFVLQVFWAYPYRELIKGNWRDALPGAGSVLICVTPHLLAIIIFGATCYLLTLIPILVLYYMFFENMNLPQHTSLFPYLSTTVPNPLPYRKQDSITRTTALPPVLAVPLAYNFNFHIEHHLFPSVPWYRLQSVRRMIREVPSCEYQEAKFLSFMVALRRRDPLDVFVRALPQHRDRGETGTVKPVKDNNLVLNTIKERRMPPVQVGGTSHSE